MVGGNIASGTAFVRKILASIALAAVAASWALTVHAIHGAPPLPARIPAHFDAAGNINGWGDAQTLWLLPIVATGVVVLLTVISFFPQTFNYPVRVTPENRSRLEAIALSVMAWLKVELACLFLWIQYVIIRSARSGRSELSPLLMVLAIALIFATVAAHLVATVRAARTNTQAERTAI
jgi:uncharacterized membrane protein